MSGPSLRPRQVFSVSSVTSWCSWPWVGYVFLSLRRTMEVSRSARARPQVAERESARAVDKLLVCHVDGLSLDELIDGSPAFSSST
jgi:hypothetical protein